MQFEEYLKQKQIDSLAFQAKDKEMYARLADIFVEIHPRSFTIQKLFLMNKIRRKYPICVKKTSQK